MWETLLLDVSEGIATITVNRPQQLNALNEQMLRDIRGVAAHIRERNDIEVVIITGSGEKAFIAGADIAVMSELTSDEAQVFTKLGQDAMNDLANLEQPVIAAVNGYCLGGGNELALACDIRIAADTAKFGQPEVGFSILASFGGTQRLPRLIGPGRAKYLLFSAEVIDAAKAFEFGLVEVVVPKAELMAAVYAYAKKITQQQRFGVRQTKMCVNYGLDSNMATGLAYEVQAYGLCYTKPARTESMKAFLAKKKK
ncbi:crotonase [Deltaproteobacteria bacterium]|nr:crotonase [Deltaproteobacteria bacterium]